MNKEKKVARTFYMEAATAKKIDAMQPDSPHKNRSEFAEAALKFYMGYLGDEDTNNYVSRMLHSILTGTLSRSYDLLNGLVFKLAVEMDMMTHIVGGNIGYNQQQLNSLRGRCVQEVKETRGRINLDNSVRMAQRVENRNTDKL